MSGEVVGIIIAIIAAFPVGYGTHRQWKARHENPTENGVDWTVNHYIRIRDEALASEAAAIKELAQYRAIYGPLPTDKETTT